MISDNNNIDGEEFVIAQKKSLGHFFLILVVFIWPCIYLPTSSYSQYTYLSTYIAQSKKEKKSTFRFKSAGNVKLFFFSLIPMECGYTQWTECIRSKRKKFVLRCCEERIVNATVCLSFMYFGAWVSILIIIQKKTTCFHQSVA